MGFDYNSELIAQLTNPKTNDTNHPGLIDPNGGKFQQLMPTMPPKYDSECDYFTGITMADYMHAGIYNNWTDIYDMDAIDESPFIHDS